jgi:hypothetical protein
MKCHLLILLFPVLLLCIQTPVEAAETPKSFYQLGNWHVHGDGPHYLDLGLGLFDAGGNRENDPAARIELRIGKKLWFIGPAVGFMANLDGGYYGYGAIYADIAWRKLVITPMLAAGAYEDGGGKDLGGTFQFRSAIGGAYQFDNLYRLGLQVAHISNADLHDFNPGEEEIFLTFSLPF